jgi:DNA-binding MarR family transcriptional regulator
MIDKMSDASRLVDRLERMNLVEKKKNVDDRRLVVVTLTEKGLKLVEEIREKDATNNTFISHLTEEEAKTLNELLDKIRS